MTKVVTGMNYADALREPLFHYRLRESDTNFFRKGVTVNRVEFYLPGGVRRLVWAAEDVDKVALRRGVLNPCVRIDYRIPESVERAEELVAEAFDVYWGLNVVNTSDLHHPG
jgi:hypothetical protein